MNIDEIKFDASIYPRDKWNTSTIQRYADAMRAGDEFPPVIVERETNRLLDGKHRLEAYKRVVEQPDFDHSTIPELRVEVRSVPEGMTPKYFAATMSARHGDRMSNADLKALALEEFEADPTMNVSAWGRKLGVAHPTVFGWVGHIVNKGKEERQGKIARLARLGWTQHEMADLLDVSQPTVAGDIKDVGFDISDIRDALNKGLHETEVAKRFNLPLHVVWAIGLEGLNDAERLKALGIKIQPYDVWNFASCHDLMGDRHPGRIPGELIAHVLYFYTKPGDLIIDPMAGSGTTLDAALLMGRKARGYDIDQRHERIDIEHHNLNNGWPEPTSKANLIFWDPPYFDKMDNQTIGADGYVEGSISKLDPDDYLNWFTKRFQELHDTVKPGTRLAFLMSDWDPENAKRHQDHPGIWLWDYAQRLQQTGWTIKRQIQTPLSTQQVHPDIVNKFRAAKRLARLERYLLMAEA